MQQKLLSFKVVAFSSLAIIVLLSFIFLGVYGAKYASGQSTGYNLYPEPSLRLELSDVDGSANYSGGWNSILDEEDPNWFSDANLNDPDWARVELSLTGNQTNKNFRICGQLASNLAVVGGIQSVNNEGTVQCTPWAHSGTVPDATQGEEQADIVGVGGGLSNPMFDGNGGSFDAMRMWMETEESGEDEEIIVDYQIGILFGDSSCNGDVKYTKWVSELASDSDTSVGAWSTHTDDVGCVRLDLVTKLRKVDVIYIPDPNQPQRDLDDIVGPGQFSCGLRVHDISGDILCPLDGHLLVESYHHNSGDRFLNFAFGDKFIHILRELAPGESPYSTYAIPDEALYRCGPDEALVGVFNQAFGDKGVRAMHCLKLKPGTINSTRATIAGAGCSARECSTRADGTLPLQDTVNYTPVYHSGQVAGEPWVYTGIWSNGGNPQYNIRGFEVSPFRVAQVATGVDPDGNPLPPPGFPVPPECEPDHSNWPNGCPMGPLPQCMTPFDDDGDGDGGVYGEDPECLSPLDNSEEEGLGEDLCTNGIDDDFDGYVDSADPGCADGGDELDTIVCGFKATPTVVALNIGTSRLSWDCRHVINNQAVSSALGNLTITDDDNSKNFPAIASPLSPFGGNAEVTPERRTVFTLHLPKAPSYSGDESDLVTEPASVDVTTTTFDEEIP